MIFWQIQQIVDIFSQKIGFDISSKLSPICMKYFALPLLCWINYDAMLTSNFQPIRLLFQVVDTNSHSKWQTVQIQITWLLQKPSDLDLHCFQQQDIFRFSRTRVNVSELNGWNFWQVIVNSGAVMTVISYPGGFSHINGFRCVEKVAGIHWNHAWLCWLSWPLGRD